MSPIQVIVGFLIASVAAIGVGIYFVMRGIRGIYEKEFPLTDFRNLSGFAAQVSGGVMAALGILAIVSGCVIIGFGMWRIVEIASQ